MDRAALAPAAARRRALALLAAALVMAMTTWFSATAVVPQLRAAWALSEAAAAGLTIAVQLGFVAGALLSALLSLPDVVPPRVVFGAGALGAAAANTGLLAADGPEEAVPLRFATGFFLAGVYPPALKLMATWYRRGRGTALGTLVGALTLGSAAPHLVNGLGGLEWRFVIAATSVLTLAGGAVAVLGVAEGPFPFPRASFDPRQAGRALRSRGVRLVSLGYFGPMWERYAMWTWFLVFVGEALARRGLGAAAAAYTTFAVIGVGALGCWAGGRVGDRLGRASTSAGLMAVSGACAVGIGFLMGAPAWAVIALGLVWGFTVVADSAQFSTAVTELADQAYVGTALTLQLALGFTLTVATIWLVPVVVAEIGWRFAFAVLAPGPALGVAAMLRLRKDYGAPGAERTA